MSRETNIIKTKIVATMGPACQDAAVIEALIQSGVTIFRLNFSHGTLDDHHALLTTLNEVRRRYPQTTAVMGDLCGPKIRTSVIQPEGEPLTPGQDVVILSGNQPGTTHCFGTSYERFIQDVHPGHRVMIDDGNIALQIVSRESDRLLARVIQGGPMHSRKGINLPDSQVSIPSVTAKDWECAAWALAHGLHYLALSFVRTADDVREVKEYLRRHNSDIKVIAKIEKPQAINQLEAIIKASDALLIARGDMGVEMDLAQVPLLQKRITRLCRQHGRPVIVATQMLQSMIEQASPTRAEVSDVANAILDLTDAVMLSGETSVGKYPVEAARWMQRVAKNTEAYLDGYRGPRSRYYAAEEFRLTAVLARSVAEIVDEHGAKLVVAWSESGSTARLLSKARIDVPIIALSSNPRMCEQMNLDYGVIPICEPIPANIQDFAARAEAVARQRGWAQTGDQIVLMSGSTLGAQGTTNTIMVHTVTEARPH